MQATDSTVRREITVNADQERAFEVFTAGFDSWWPRAHHIGQSELLAAIIEPKVGGRWYERGIDGSECDWGKVLVWEAPARVVLSWHLDGNWAFDPDPAKASEVELRFVAESESRTRVELEHRGIERAHAAEQLRAGVDSEQGWNGLLQLFVAAAQN